MYAFYIYLAIQVLKRVLPMLEKRTKETPNPYDDSVLAVVELAIELYETGKLKPSTVVITGSKLDV